MSFIIIYRKRFDGQNGIPGRNFVSSLLCKLKHKLFQQRTPGFSAHIQSDHTPGTVNVLDWHCCIVTHVVYTNNILKNNSNNTKSLGNASQRCTIQRFMPSAMQLHVMLWYCHKRQSLQSSLFPAKIFSTNN